MLLALGRKSCSKLYACGQCVVIVMHKLEAVRILEAKLKSVEGGRVDLKDVIRRHCEQKQKERRDRGLG